MKLRNFSRCFGCKVITPTSSMNQSELRVINLLKAREKWRVQCAIKRNDREIIFAKNGKLNLVLVLVLEPKGPSYKLVWRQIFVWLPTDAEHYFLTNNIHEKISPFWLIKSSAVFFFKTVQKRVNSVQKEETNQAFWLVNDQRNSQMANQIFCFQIKRTPWMTQLMAWYACVPSAQLSWNFFIYIINK